MVRAVTDTAASPAMHVLDQARTGTGVRATRYERDKIRKRTGKNEIRQKQNQEQITPRMKGTKQELYHTRMNDNMHERDPDMMASTMRRRKN